MTKIKNAVLVFFVHINIYEGKCYFLSIYPSFKIVCIKCHFCVEHIPFII